MIAPPIPVNEKERLHELYKYELLDSVYEQEFDDIVQLASRLCNAPISTISLIDFDRQWFKAKTGLNDSESERNVSFCAHAINQDIMMEVPDVTVDERFFDNPLVLGDPNIRYYAGMPLITSSGYKLGTLCVIDRMPRKLDPEQTFALKVLSKQVIKLFELRTRQKELKKISDLQQQIMSIMAHDIRGPLASLKSVYEMKITGIFTKEEEMSIDALVPRQLDSTLNLLNNIVAWGSLQLGNANQHDEEVSIFDMCDECISYYLLAADAKGNSMLNLVSPSISYIGNKQGLEFVLRNLLGNANKFTDKGDIIVSARIHGDCLEIYVTDTGVGMTEDVIESISERTWSVYTAGTNNEKGSGMGLKLMFEYLSNIQGTLKFESKPGEGTTVTVSLPVTDLE
jgi:signal transduction histidine kinase